MGKNNRHSKDRMYLSNHELQSHKGLASTAVLRRLPFDHCALSLTPFKTPCCGPEGVVFDLVTLVPYLQKHKANPVSGEPMTSRDILRLNISQNAAGEWQCPVTFKVFNDSSHIVAIRTTGNVFSYEAVAELNVKAKNWEDLLTGEAFCKKDIVTLLDNQDAAHAARRDIANFVHVQTVREVNSAAEAAAPSIRHNPTAEGVLKELAKRKAEELASGVTKKSLEEIFSGGGDVADDAAGGEDVAELLALQPTVEEINPGALYTDSKKSGSLTSTSYGTITTASSTRLARASELRDARFRKMKELKQKALVQLQTSCGQINLELAADLVPRTCWNFITLCSRGYYDDKPFHRLVPGFALQGGSETGMGKGGASAFPGGRVFADEFHPHLSHDARGVLAMANSGPNCNKSQFYISLGECKYLDHKHSVFGRVVGGNATLERIEEVGADDREVPLTDIRIIKALVFQDPLAEADALVRRDIMSKRAPSSFSSSSSSSFSLLAETAAKLPPGTAADVVGRYVIPAGASVEPSQQPLNQQEVPAKKAKPAPTGNQFNFSKW